MDRKKIRTAIPLVVFVAIAGFLAVGLTLKPRDIPSAMIDKPAPLFALPPMLGKDRGLSNADFPSGEMSLVNVYASWCAPCRVEHPRLMEMAAQGVPIFGINYKDRPRDAQRLLKLTGDPYITTGVDADGRTSIEWGVYGVPETFVIDGEGRIVYKHIGPMTHEIIDTVINPLLNGTP
jgi:cytochrome c biogenesis protein CcmG, thiol:disulfide interchange protein DsbE